MSETKKFSKRIQDILDGLEFRTGKRKVQTKEDLKKCFRKECVNAYSAEEDGKPRLYRRNDLTAWATETFARGEKYFYAEPIDPNEPCGKLKLTKLLIMSRTMTRQKKNRRFCRQRFQTS